VFQLSRGIPRSINLVCDSALIYGFSEGLPVIDRTMVAKAANQLDLMGLVDARAPGEAAVPAPGAKEAGDGTAILEGIGNLEKKLAGFMGELRRETRTLGGHAASVSSGALKLSELLEKHLAQDRAAYEKLQADSTKLKLLLKVINRSPKP
jgi:hypothetical protein